MITNLRILVKADIKQKYPTWCQWDINQYQQIYQIQKYMY